MLRLIRYQRIALLSGVTGLAMAIVTALASQSWQWTLFALVLTSLAVGIALILRTQLAAAARELRASRKLLDKQQETLRQQRDRITAVEARVARELDPQFLAALRVLNQLHEPLKHGLVLRDDLKASEARLQRESRRSTAQIEAFLQLRDLASPRGFLPATRGWAASADYLLLLVDIVRRERPQLVVDLGSGLTTVWTALVAEQEGIDCRIVSIDHDAEFAAGTQQLVDQLGLSSRIDLRIAPMTPVTIGDTTTTWYDPQAFDDLSGIDLVSVDGPPGTTHALARYPALPLLATKLSSACTVLLDDAARDDERATVDRWLKEFDAFTETVVDLEKGASVLRRV